MSRKTMEREARQQFVVQAARGLFSSKGVENTSMEDIAAAVDYTRRTLYSYFKSRDEICLMVFCEDLAKRWAEQNKAIAKVDTGLRKIMAWGKSFYVFARENPHSMRLQFYWDFKGIERKRISPGVFSEFESLNYELAEGLREIFKLGIRDRSLRPNLHVDLSISQFLYTLRSIINRAISPAYSFAKFEPDEYVRHYLDLFSRGIRNIGGK
jgi:AcrR family transcriptional regulator